MYLVDFNNVRIEGNTHRLEKNFYELPDVFSVRIRVKGNLANGFIDSHYVCRQNNGSTYPIWIPDQTSYLSDIVGYNFGRQLVIRSEHDTGILQRNTDETIELTFRIRDFDREYYYLNQGDIIDRIEIDIWVDPLHVQNLERIYLENETIVITNNSTNVRA